MSVPAEWASFDAIEAATLRRQFKEQSKQIYERFSGAAAPTEMLDIAAFHIRNDAGSFIVVSFTVPATSDLITLLQSQADQKRIGAFVKVTYSSIWDS